MEINQALLNDNALGAEVLLALDAIAGQLSIFGIKYPNTFTQLCFIAAEAGEMDLWDGVAAFNWAIDQLTEGK